MKILTIKLKQYLYQSNVTILSSHILYDFLNSLTVYHSKFLVMLSRYLHLL